MALGLTGSFVALQVLQAGKEPLAPAALEALGLLGSRSGLLMLSYPVEQFRRGHI